MKRAAAIAVAAIALGAAVASTLAIGAGHRRTARENAARAGIGARDAARQAVQKRMTELEARGTAAAAIPHLQSALAGPADGPTIVDLFDNEDWWAPFRSAFPTTAIVVDGRSLALRGPGVGGTDEVIVAAGARGAAADAVASSGKALWVAAAKLDAPKRGRSVAVVLAREVVPSDLAPISPGVAVVLSDGRGALLGSGPADGRKRLEGYAGGRGSEATITDPDGAWAVSSEPVGRTLWQWTLTPLAGTTAGGGREISIVWTIAGLIVIAALALGFRPRPQPARSDGELSSESATGGGRGISLGAASRPTEPAPPGSLPGAPAPGGPGAASPTASPMPKPFHQAPTVPPAGSMQPGVGASAAQPAEPGATDVFGRYRLIERIGEGGMGEIWKAATYGAEGFTRTFVLKRLRAELTRDPEVVAQFIDEARLGAGLVHSNIIPVFDFGKVGNEYFIAQEYVIGRDLGRITRRSGEKAGRFLGPSIVFHIAAQTLEALSYAHAKRDTEGKPIKLVHRDVSPNNIMVTPRGEVKLLDFGIVKAEGRKSQTQVGMVKGNIAFMSPEQACSQPIDGRSDLFSLGLVMFYCLTGETLYKADTTFDLLIKAGTGPTEQDRQRIEALNSPANEIVGRALAIDSAARYQTASQFAAALAPHTLGASTKVVSLMQLLFADEFRAEGV